jgi:hypothetical protein
VDSDITDVNIKRRWDRIKIAVCLLLLFGGFLVYLGGFLSMNLFAGWIVLGFYLCCGLGAATLTIMNCIMSIVFLVQKIRYTKTCVFILSCSLVFMIYLIIVYKIPKIISDLIAID